MDPSPTDMSPMDCDDALHRVYEYLDGEMTVWRRRAITRHLDECPPCAQGFVFEVELRRISTSKTKPSAQGGHSSRWRVIARRRQTVISPSRYS